MLMNSPDYLATIEQTKQEIRTSQYRATMHVNADLLLLYHNIGQVINTRKSWGNKFIENLAKNINPDFPPAISYSVRNLKYMAKFSLTYPNRGFVQTPSAQIPWSHNIAILDEVQIAPNP